MFPISKSVSRLALVAALALGGTAGALGLAAPAAAKEAKAEGGSYSPAFAKGAAAIQKEMDALSTKKGKVPEAELKATANQLAPRVEALVPSVSTPMDKAVAGQWLYQVGTTGGNDQATIKGLDLMLASGTLPPTTAAQVSVMRGQYAYVGKDYAKAIELLGPQAAAGAADETSVRMLADAYVQQNRAAEGIRALQTAIRAQQGAGKAVPESWYKAGLSLALNTKALNDAGLFSSGLASNYPSTANWAVAISVVRMLGAFQPQDMLDLLRLMDRTNSFSEGNEYLDYIQSADARRLPGEVNRIIAKGMAAGKISTSDTFVAESRTIASTRMAADKASLPAAERDARAPAASTAAVMGVADAFLSYEQPATAESLYQVALAKPGVDANRALTRLGIAQVDQGKYAEAQASFAKVTGVRKPIADLWSIYAAQKAKGG